MHYFLLIDELQKPWLVKKSESKSSSAVSSTEACGDTVAEKEDKILGEVEKVNTILKQARRIRQGQEKKAAPEHSGKSGRRKQLGKPSCAHLKEPDTSSKNDNLSASKRQRESASTKVPFKVKQINDPKSLAESSAQMPSTSKPALNEKASGDYLNLKDILKERFLSSKYRKLRQMHNKLVQSLSNCDLDEKPCKSATNFMMKFYQAQESEDDGANSKLEFRVITPHTAKIAIPRAINRCQNLLYSLNYKLAYSEDEVTPVSLYYQQLVYSNFSKAADDLESYLNSLRKMDVSDASLFDEEPLCLFRNSAAGQIPCLYQTFENVEEVQRNAQLMHEINWTKVILMLKQKLHDVIMAEEMFSCSDTGKEQSVNPDSARCLTLAYGLFAKKHRCSINPAVVLNDS